MGLFGPNIQRMKEQKDTEGLLRELDNSDHKIRIDAIEALKEIGDPRSIDRITKKLINILEFGEPEDQAEAITIIQGRAPDSISFFISGEPKRIDALTKVHGKLSLEPFRNALLELVQKCKSGGTVWYALVALAELGDRSDEVLLMLIEFSDEWIKTLDKQIDATGGAGPIIAWSLGKSANKETLRALSYYKGTGEATEAIIKAYEGDLLSSPRISGDKKNAVYALAALGDPSTLERLEYLVSQGSAPNIILDFFGKANFEQIEDMVESGVVPGNVPTGSRCPICDSKTTMRTAQRGPNAGSKFHVCNNYPDCKGKLAVE